MELRNKKYKNIQYTTVSENDEKSLEEELKMAKSDCKYIMMVFSLDEEMGYKASLKYGDKSSVDKTDLEEFASDMNAEFAGIMAKSVGVSKETLDLINKDTTTKVTTNATKELFEEMKLSMKEERTKRYVEHFDNEEELEIGDR